ELLHPLASFAARADWNQVSDRQVLELRNDALGAGVTQVVEQIVAVPAGTPGANLDQPWPDLLGRCADGNRPRGVEGRLKHVVIARQSTPHFVVGGTPAQLHRAE